MPTTLPYGSWPSPITLDQVVAAGKSASAPWLDDEDLYLLESRPADAGRTTLIRRGPDGRWRDAIPAGFNVRTRVHEYGGGAYTARDGVLVFSNFGDNLDVGIMACPDLCPSPQRIAVYAGEELAILEQAMGIRPARASRKARSPQSVATKAPRKKSTAKARPARSLESVATKAPGKTSTAKTGPAKKAARSRAPARKAVGKAAPARKAK